MADHSLYRETFFFKKKIMSLCYHMYPRPFEMLPSSDALPVSSPTVSTAPHQRPTRSHSIAQSKRCNLRYAPAPRNVSPNSSPTQSSRENASATKGQSPTPPQPHVS